MMKTIQDVNISKKTIADNLYKFFIALVVIYFLNYYDFNKSLKIHTNGSDLVDIFSFKENKETN